MREFVELFDPVRQSYRQFLWRNESLAKVRKDKWLTGEKLASFEESALTGILAKQDHLLQGDCGESAGEKEWWWEGC